MYYPPHLLRRRQGWADNHHVVTSKVNEWSPRNQRAYFDHLPVVRYSAKGAAGEADGWPSWPGSARLLPSIPRSAASGRPLVSPPGTARRVSRMHEGDAPSIDLLAAAAAAAAQLQRGASGGVLPPVPSARCAHEQPLEQPPTARSRRRRLGALTTESDQPAQGQNDPVFLQFVAWGEAKFPNMVSLWRLLDVNASGYLHKMELVKGLKEFGYPGKIDELWSCLDLDHRGTIDFFEFAPRSARLLSTFKHWVRSRFGSGRAFFHALDVDRNGKLGMHEFVHGCMQHGIPLQLDGQVESVFWLLDTVDSAYFHKDELTADEMGVLDVWKFPGYFFGVPDHAAKSYFRSALLGLHKGNPIVAWRSSLDRAEKMVLHWDDFKIACHTLATVGVLQSASEEAIASLYVSHDPDKIGFFHIRSWDPDAYRLLAAFTAFARRKQNTPSRFIRCLGNKEDGGVLVEDFDIATEGMSLSHKDLRTLFLGLSRGFETVHWRDAAFLDSWDLDLGEDPRPGPPDVQSLLSDGVGDEARLQAAEQCRRRGSKRMHALDEEAQIAEAAPGSQRRPVTRSGQGGGTL